jgi:hypothetical protein
MDITDELVELERRGWQALATEGGAAVYYDWILDDEPLMLLPGGLVLTDRAAILDSMSGPPWHSFHLEVLRAVMLNDDCGIVAYEVVAERPGTPAYSALMSTTYACRHGQWKVAVHQQTPR